MSNSSDKLSNSSTQKAVWKLLNQLSARVGVSEIVFNGYENIFAEKEGKFYHLDTQIRPEDIDQFIQEVAGFNYKKCDSDYPIMDGVLPDGARINIIMPPFSKVGPAITIRRYRYKLKTFDEEPGIFGLNQTWVHFLKSLVKAKMNVVISGGTAVGKTTFMNMLLQEIPHEERIICIEDTRELHFPHPHVLFLESGGQNLASKEKVTYQDLVRNALRMRPDRIIVGEVRGAEVIDLLSAMNTGHKGCMTSLHANSAQEALGRLDTLYLMGGKDLPLKAIHGQIFGAIDFILQLGRDKKGQRVLMQITEICGMEGETILTQQLAQYQQTSLRSTGLATQRMKSLVQEGLPGDFFQKAA
jgi:pilus assembly protein CpaF